MAPVVKVEDHAWDVDVDGFLREPEQWREQFAEAMAPGLGLEDLSREHWDVIRIIRETFVQTGRCPTLYETCRRAGLHLAGLQRLFPTGYLRGACLLAGLSFKEGYLGHGWQRVGLDDVTATLQDRTFRVDIRGFLVDPTEWNEAFAATKAFEMKMPELGDRHWKVIRFLRRSAERTGQVPTVFETCSALGLDLDELERLFPDGYHRGAVKVAGLRVR